MLGSSNSWTSIQPSDLEAWHRVLLASDACVSICFSPIIDNTRCVTIVQTLIPSSVMEHRALPATGPSKFSNSGKSFFYLFVPSSTNCDKSLDHFRSHSLRCTVHQCKAQHCWSGYSKFASQSEIKPTHGTTLLIFSLILYFTANSAFLSISARPSLPLGTTVSTAAKD